jgi:hypothetical protein
MTINSQAYARHLAVGASMAAKVKKVAG